MEQQAMAVREENWLRAIQAAAQSGKTHLRVLLEMLPEWNVHENPENIEFLLPWDEYIQDRFE